jgi:hypothetical protein
VLGAHAISVTNRQRRWEKLAAIVCCDTIGSNSGFAQIKTF